MQIERLLIVDCGSMGQRHRTVAHASDLADREASNPEDVIAFMLGYAVIARLMMFGGLSGLIKQCAGRLQRSALAYVGRDDDLKRARAAHVAVE